jgi:hypothetical protein
LVEAIDSGNFGGEALDDEAGAGADIGDGHVGGGAGESDGGVAHLFGEVAGAEVVPFGGDFGEVGFAHVLSPFFNAEAQREICSVN